MRRFHARVLSRSVGAALSLAMVFGPALQGAGAAYAAEPLPVQSPVQGDIDAGGVLTKPQ